MPYAYAILRSNPLRDKAFSERFAYAWALYKTYGVGRAAKGYGASQQWIADQVSRRLGRRKAYTQPTVSNWANGEIPSPQVVIALAETLSWEPGIVDPGWLMFGDRSRAPAPPDPIRAGMTLLPRP